MNNSYTKVPTDLTNLIKVRKFLLDLVVQVDKTKDLTGNDNILDSNITNVELSDTYNKSKVQQVLDNQIIINKKLNEIISVLRTSKLISV